MDLKEISDSFITKKYVEMCREVSRYYKTKLEPPTAIKHEYDLALSDLRILLNSNGYFMPQQKYPYDAQRTETHKYVKMQVINDSGVTQRREVLNPKWMYANFK